MKKESKICNIYGKMIDCPQGKEISFKKTDITKIEGLTNFITIELRISVHQSMIKKVERLAMY